VHTLHTLHKSSAGDQFWSLSLHEVAQQLSHILGRPEKTLAGLQLLYRQLGLFTSLVSSNRKVISSLLWQSAAQTSAVQQRSSNVQQRSGHLRGGEAATSDEKIAFIPFACKGSVARHDREVLYYVTEENFEDIKIHRAVTVRRPAGPRPATLPGAGTCATCSIAGTWFSSLSWTKVANL